MLHARPTEHTATTLASLQTESRHMPASMPAACSPGHALRVDLEGRQVALEVGA